MAAPVSQFEEFHAINVGNTPTTVFTATDDCYLLQFDISAPPTTGIQVDVSIIKASSGQTVKWLRSVLVPVAATLQAIEETKKVLKAGDQIVVTCLTSGQTVDVDASYIDKVNLGTP